MVEPFLPCTGTYRKESKMHNADHTVNYVTTLPDCDVHRVNKGESGVPAKYDGALNFTSSWANMCADCFAEFGVGLGLGKGQELVVGEAPERDRHAEFNDALARNASFDELEDIVGDGDIADFL